MESLIWKDHKGREIQIHTMTNKWLNNIRKYLPLNNPTRIEIIKEIKRRKTKTYNRA